MRYDLSVQTTKNIAHIWVTFNIVVIAGLLMTFQNCSQARFSMAGEESKVGGLGGPITPGDPANPNDPNNPVDPNNPNNPGHPVDPNDPKNPDHPGCDEDAQYVECGPELLLNGDFEAVDQRQGLVSSYKLDSLFSSKSWDVFATLPAEGSGVSWYAEDGTSGIEVQGGAVVAAASGKLSVELDSHPNSSRGSRANSGMYQIVNLSEDSKYSLSFSYRGRTNSPDDNRIDVFIGDEKIRSVADGQTSTWQKVRVNRQISKGLRKILFRAAGAQTTYGGLLDQVSLKKLCPKKK